MGRLLTLMMLMILGALAVRTQQPSPYATGGSINGVAWREMSQGEKAYFVNGAGFGYIKGVMMVVVRQYGECRESVEASLPAWAEPKAKVGDIAKEMDSFYQDGANISIPMIDAFVYTRMKLGGATKQELDAYLKAVR